MRSTADPYPSSTESLATDGKGEIERIRYQILQIGKAIGKATTFTQWYHDFPDTTGASSFILLDNTAADGDPGIQLLLSGSAVFTIAVDDSDSDYLKFGTTALTTNVAMQVPTGGAKVEFAVGSSTAPSLTFIGDTDIGMYRVSADALGFTCPTGGDFYFVANDVIVLRFEQTSLTWWPDTTTKTIDLGVSTQAFDDMYADDFNNVADIEFFDVRKDPKTGQIETLDDCAIIKAIQPKKDKDGNIVFNEKGNAFWDDSTLPTWIFTEDKNRPGNLVVDKDGKPWISLRILSALSLGAIGQLIKRVEALEISA